MYNNISTAYADALMRNIYDRSLPHIERDSAIDQMEQNLFATLNQIAPDEPAAETVKSNKQLPSDNKFVSLEDAIKELDQMQKQGLL